MNDNFKFNLLVQIKNSVALICFTILAIIFEKWWIVFFSIVFFVELTKKEK